MSENLNDPKNKSNPNYRNKFYEMQDLIKSKAKLKSELKNLQENYSNKNNNNEYLDDENPLNTNSKKSKTIPLIQKNKFKNNEINNYKNNQEFEKHYKTTDRAENIFIKSSSQLMKNRLMKNIFSKRKFMNFLGIPIARADSQINIYARNWKMFDSLMILSNFFIMIFAFLDYEINFTYPRTEIPKNYTLRYLIIFVSFFSILCVILRHYYKLKWNNFKFYEAKKKDYYSEVIEEDDEWLFLDENLNFNYLNNISGGRFRKFIKFSLFTDILVNLLVPNPFFDFIIKSIEMDRDENEYVKIDYLYSDLMFIFIIIRIVYLIRATINYSIFTDDYANKLSKEMGIKCNIRFALKCLFKTYDIKFVIVFFFVSNLILGFVLRVFERPFWAYKNRTEFDYLSNSLWLVFVTMLTIGFGEFVPLSFGGRVICILAGLWGIFICSLIVVSLYGLFDLSKNQFSTFVNIIKGRSAVKFIENAYIFKNKKRKNKLDMNSAKIEYDEMLSAFIAFKKMRNESDTIYRSNGSLFYSNRLMQEIKKVKYKFDKFENDLEEVYRNSLKRNEILAKKEDDDNDNFENNRNKMNNLDIEFFEERNDDKKMHMHKKDM